MLSPFVKTNHLEIVLAPISQHNMVLKMVPVLRELELPLLVKAVPHLILDAYDHLFFADCFESLGVSSDQVGKNTSHLFRGTLELAALRNSAISEFPIFQVAFYFIYCCLYCLTNLLNAQLALRWFLKAINFALVQRSFFDVEE